MIQLVCDDFGASFQLIIMGGFGKSLKLKLRAATQVQIFISDENNLLLMFVVIYLTMRIFFLVSLSLKQRLRKRFGFSICNYGFR